MFWVTEQDYKIAGNHFYPIYKMGNLDDPNPTIISGRKGYIWTRFCSAVFHLLVKLGYSLRSLLFVSCVCSILSCCLQLIDFFQVVAYSLATAGILFSHFLCFPFCLLQCNCWVHVGGSGEHFRVTMLWARQLMGFHCAGSNNNLNALPQIWRRIWHSLCEVICLEKLEMNEESLSLGRHCLADLTYE